MTRTAFFAFLTVPLAAAAGVGFLAGAPEDAPSLRVPRVDDFELSGDGTGAAWAAAEWTELRKRGGEHDYTARIKALHSSRGIYFLFEGSDRKVTATMAEDFMDLWKEDVFEVFLWTDERHPIYFEYEISPLGRELPILVPNVDGKFLGWRPWRYDGDRSVRKKVAGIGGELRSGADIRGWRAEVFVPYALLAPLGGVPPEPGSRWRANFYRVDHDGGKTTAWDWARVGPSFHEFQRFGTLVFGPVKD